MQNKKKIGTAKPHFLRAVLLGCMITSGLFVAWYYVSVVMPVNESQAREQVLDSKTLEFQATHHVNFN
jgi:surface polysaccharide O-acyltransferase-like enzyme